MTEEIKDQEVYWDKHAIENAKMTVISKNYTDGELWASGERDVSRMEKHWDRVDDREVCFEYGCGIGRCTFALAKRFKKVIAVDISSEMLKKAEEYRKQLGVENVEFIKVGGDNLSEFKSGEYPFIFSILVLQHIEPATVRENLRADLCRILKPGGWLYLQDLYPQQWREGMKDDYRNRGIAFMDVLSEDAMSVYGWYQKKGSKRKGNPILSIIIPTYNQEKFIRETMESILNQSFQQFEIIVVNDGSTDGTKKIVEDYALNDDRIVVIHQANKKLPGALNTGLKHIRGKYVTWMSSDSLYKPGALEFLVSNMDKQPPEIGVVFADFEIFGKRDGYIARQPKVYKCFDMLQGNFVGACFIFRKECVDKVGEYDCELECVEDWDYWIRISEYYDLIHIPGYYVRWRDHGDNMSNTHCFILGPVNKVKMLEKAAQRRKARESK